MTKSRRQTAKPSGTTHTFRFHRGRQLTIGIFSSVIGIAFLAGVIVGWSSNSVLWEIGFFAGGAFFIWAAICAFRAGAQVSGQKLTIYNELGFHIIDANNIRAITLQPHAEVNRAAHWIPQVELTSGRNVMITDFDCGVAKRPPIPERAALLQELRALLGVEADDPGPPGSDSGGPRHRG